VAVSVAGAIEPTLQAAEIRRATAPTRVDLTVYDLYLRALAAMFPTTKEGVLKALGLLERAIEVDPRYGPALAWAANGYQVLVNNGWVEDTETSRLKAGDLARRALQVGESDPTILANPAFVLAHLGEDIGAMTALIDRALTLNPSFARGWYRSGILRLFAGQPDLAIKHAEISLRLSPRERIGQPTIVVGAAYFFKRQFDKAASKLLLAIQDDPGLPGPYRILAACYAHMGRLKEAREVVRRLRSITSIVIPDASFLRDVEHRELFLSGLHLAAGEAR
jgi:tetratricopeptide (TPR) repeat protein